MRLLLISSLILISGNTYAGQPKPLWSTELTTPPGSNKNGNMKNGTDAIDCEEGSVDGIDVIDLPGGGAFEWRFMPFIDSTRAISLDPTLAGQSRHQFQYLPQASENSFASEKGEITRACPRIFNGSITTEHTHGLLNLRLAVMDDLVFGVSDETSGYYRAMPIVLVQDPSNIAIWKQSSLAANRSRPFWAAEFMRNPYNFVRIDPASAYFGGRFDSNSDYEYDSSNDGCERAQGWGVGGQGPGLSSSGVRFDPEWKNHFGIDHERTYCAPPAAIRTLDPDVSIASAWTFVTWSETIMDEKFGTQKGLVSGTPQSGKLYVPGYQDDASIFPYHRLGVHVDAVDTSYLKGSSPPSFTGPRRAKLTLNTEGGLRVGSNVDAFEPRITTLKNGSLDEAVVVWAETAFGFLSDTQDFPYAPNGGLPAARAFGPAPGTVAPLYAKWNSTLTTDWTSLPAGNQPIGQVCNIQSTSSFIATGRWSSFGGTHDITTISYQNQQRPVIVSTDWQNGACHLVVRVWNGSQWVQLGGNLDVSGAAPSWPRIVTTDNATTGNLYVVWLEKNQVGEFSKDYVMVKRWSGSGWDAVGNASGRYWDASWNVWGPSIAVTANPWQGSSGGGSASYSQVMTERVAVVMSKSPDAAPSNYSVPAMITDKTIFGLTEVISTKCTISSVLIGSNIKCGEGEAKLDTQPLKAHTTGANAVDFTNRLGYSWGRRQVGPGQSKSGPTWGGFFQYRELVDFTYDKYAARPGGTDLVAGKTKLYAGYGCMFNNHREFDRGFCVKAQSVNLASAGPDALVPLYMETGMSMSGKVGLGGNFLQVWGDNTWGQLGNGTFTASKTPIQINFAGLRITQARFGAYMSAALAVSDGGAAQSGLYTWGYGGFGQLGGGSFTTRNTPARIPGSETIVEFALGDYHAVARDRSGIVYTWGDNSYGQLGNGGTGSSVANWTQVRLGSSTGPYLTDAVRVASGSLHSCAIRAGGQVVCWGYGGYGALGAGSFDSRPYAVAVASDLKGKDLELGAWHTVAVGFDGRLYVWGGNYAGQLGLGDYTNRAAPTLAVLPGSVDGFSVGRQATYIIGEETGGGAAGAPAGLTRRLWVAGANYSGELDMPQSSSTYPYFFAITDHVERIASNAQSDHAYIVHARDASRRVLKDSCFGSASYGQCHRPTFVPNPGGFGNNENRVIALFGESADTVNLTVDSNTENGYDFVWVTDSAGHSYSQTGIQSRSYTGLVAPVTVRFTSDYSVASTSVAVNNISYW